MNIKMKAAFLAATALSATNAAPAWAQSAAAKDAADDTGRAEEIVVTGTLIRGIAPGGSQSIGVSQEKITSLGVATTSDLVSAIPQAGFFNNFNAVRGSSGVSLAINRPSLRYLGFTSSATASTLLLLDGHRMPGMGVTQNSADLDAIAAGAIERVEVVTDGGSSTYGSDAVGGVMNFITRREFDGVEARANYGIGSDYQTVNATVTAGKKWDGGSAYISYDYSHHDEIYAGDRDWYQFLDWPATQAAGRPVGSSFNCTPGNVGISGQNFALPGLTSANRCDNFELATFYPRETKHSALASVVIDNGGPVSFSVKAFYVHRVDRTDFGPATQNVTVTPASPFYIPLANFPGGGAGLSGNQTFRVNFGSLLGNNNYSTVVMESWGITPSVKVDLGSQWQVNAMFNYGRGTSNYNSAVYATGTGATLNAAPLNAGTAPGAAVPFDPRNIGLASNAAAITAARDWYQLGRAKQELVNLRAVADGPLFTMPGGELRVAVGAEYMHEKYDGVISRTTTAAAFAATPDNRLKRSVKSVFGEVNLPIIGADNRGFIHSLSLTASARYDDYSDFGHTFNPKLGINFEPTEWLRLRGNWGKAFQAPGLYDISQQGPTTISPLSPAAFSDPATPVVAGRSNVIAFSGSVLGLKPQKATTWSLGFDIKPPASGFAAGMTYYNIKFKGVITFPQFTVPSFYTNLADHVVLYPAGNDALKAYFTTLAATSTPARVANILTTIGCADIATCTFANVYSLIDARVDNIGSVSTDGLDFYARYTHETGFGDIYADIAGTYILSLKTGGTTGLGETNGFDPNNKFKLQTTVGTHVGNLQAQVTWAHNSSMATAPSAANLQQSRVSGFNLFNLFFQYKVPGDSAIAKDLAFTLNVDNVFDTDPPFYRGLSNSLYGAGNGFTLGRVVKFGVSKKF